MPRFAFSTNAFVKCSVEEAIAQIAAAGYDGVELMLDAPHLFPRDATAQKVESIRRAAETAGVAFSNANAFMMNAVGDTWNPSWIDPEPAVRRQRIEHTAMALRIARDLGIPNVSTEPGGQMRLVGKSDKSDRSDVSDGSDVSDAREAAMRLFVAGIEEVLPVAEETGVDLLVEPEPHLLIERTTEYLDFAARISHPRLGLNFDIGHFFCVGEDPADAFRTLWRGPASCGTGIRGTGFQPVNGTRPGWPCHVRHVHLEDIAATREHRHLIPGTGAIDLPHVVRTMIDEGYGGWITVELYPYQDAPYEAAVAALEYVRRELRQV